MPQFNAYPAITSLEDTDLLLVWDDSAGAVKTVEFSDFKGSIDLADTTGTLPIARGGLGTSLISPGADRILFWDNSEGKFAYLTAGTNLNISGNTISATGAGGSSFAPDTGNYITQTVNGALPNAQPLAALGTGLVKNTTGTGVLSIGVAGTDFVAPGAVTSSGLTSSATSRIIGRKTASGGALEEITVSNVLDFISTTQGAVLYRGFGSWAALAPGTSGQFLKTNGVSADPAWASGNPGDVIGPGSATDNAIVRFDLATGKLIQSSNATLTDAGALTLPSSVTASALILSGGGIAATVTTAAANYTVLAADSTVIYTGTGGHTITLVDAATSTGRILFIKNNGSGAAITIDATGLGQLVPSTGAANTVSLAANAFLVIQAGNSKWQVLAQ
jgi:hypothetical protein